MHARTLVALSLAAALPAAAQQLTHLNVPGNQVGVVAFAHRPGDTTVTLYPTTFTRPDGSTLSLEAGIPAGYILVLTDLRFEIVRKDSAGTYPLQGFNSLYAQDTATLSTSPLHTMQGTLPAAVSRWTFKESFTTGFAFAGTRLPTLVPMVYNTGTSSGFGNVNAYGYLVQGR